MKLLTLVIAGDQNNFSLLFCSPEYVKNQGFLIAPRTKTKTGRFFGVATDKIEELLKSVAINANLDVVKAYVVEFQRL